MGLTVDTFRELRFKRTQMYLTLLPSRQQCGAFLQQCFEEIPQFRRCSSAMLRATPALRRYFSEMLSSGDEAFRMKPPKCFRNAFQQFGRYGRNCAGALRLWHLVGPLALGVPPLPMPTASLQPFSAPNPNPHIPHALQTAYCCAEVILAVEHLQVDVVDRPSLPPAAQCNGT